MACLNVRACVRMCECVCVRVCVCVRPHACVHECVCVSVRFRGWSVAVFACGCVVYVRVRMRVCDKIRERRIGFY